MTNILVPTDFSANAWNAIRYGLQFFKDEPANFYLLHVSVFEGPDLAHDISANGGLIDFVSVREEGATIKDMLHHTLERIKDNFPNSNHKFFSIQEQATFVQGIKNSIAAYGIDFILMGTKGASGLLGSTIGSRAGEVITRIKCPTLVIPENAHYNQIKEVVFPTDFNSYYKNRVLLNLAELLAMNNAKLHVLHMKPPHRKLTEQQLENKIFLEDFLQDKRHAFQFSNHRTIETAVSNFLSENRIDIIAMVAKNINFFQRLLFKPSVAKISYHTKTPFFVLHE